MKLKHFIGNMSEGLRQGVSRFVYAFFSTAALWAVISYSIITEDFTKLSTALCFGIVFGLLLSVLIVLTAEKTRFNEKSLLFSLISIIPAAACVLVIYNIGFDNDYLQMGYFGIITAFVSLIVFILCRDNQKNKIIPHLVKSLIVSYAISGVLCAGFSICIAAADYLIFGLDDIYKVYATVCLFIAIVVGINMFLSYIPGKDDDVSLPKIFKIILLYAALPVYLLLIAILYVYFVKILVTWNLPSGEINWFASYASLFYVFFMFCLRPYEDKLAVLFKKYASFFIIPVIAIQTLAIIIRINAYGFTTPRFISVILVFISLLFALFDIIEKKPEKVFLASAIIALAVCLTPLNIIDIPKKDQINRLYTALVRNNMLNDEGNKIIPNPDVSEKDKEIIIGSYSYVQRAAGKLPDYIENIEKKYEHKTIFGFTKNTESQREYCYYSSKVDFDISGYSYIVDYNSYKKGNETGVESNYLDSTFEIDAEALIKKLYNEYGNEYSSLPIIEIDAKHSLIIKHLNANITPEQEIEHYGLEGYILIR